MVVFVRLLLARHMEKVSVAASSMFKLRFTEQNQKLTRVFAAASAGCGTNTTAGTKRSSLRLK